VAAHNDDSRGGERTLHTSCEEEVEELCYYRRLLDAGYHQVERVVEEDSILHRVAAVVDKNGAVPRAEADRELAASVAPKLAVPVAVEVASNPFAASSELAQQRPE
jgi:hypothetical protein